MSSIQSDHQISSELLQYRSIFKHYGFEGHSTSPDDESSIELNKNLPRDSRYLFDTQCSVWERNENKKKKHINAKTTTKRSSARSKHRRKSRKKSKSPKGEKVIKITVPKKAKTHKASHSGAAKKMKKQSKHAKKTKKRSKRTKIAPSTPVIAVQVPSSSTINTDKGSTSFQSKADHPPSNTNLLLLPNASSHPSHANKSVPVANKTVTQTTPLWDLEEINQFTREMFKLSSGDYDKSSKHRYQIRLNCKNQDGDLEGYIKSQSHCLDVFNEYVTSLNRQHGFIHNAASDPPIFDPGISITGPKVKKDPADIDREDARAVKRMNGIEPRKKYALIHEEIGIFILGGYNLFVDIPIQKEPTTDYLFKSNGSVVHIPPLHPCRANFAIYADHGAIYVAGGQTIYNELLDDIQRLNLSTLKWEHVATLPNPIAACGMTLDDNRIHLIGGYDIIKNQTCFLSDCMIYNLSTEEFEKSTYLPSPRCRSLVFATDQAIFCISGLVEGRNENQNKKLRISTDILKWSYGKSEWIKVSQTPELTKSHALSFNEPYLEITKRIVDDKGDEIDTIVETHYDFHTNLWTSGKAPFIPIKTEDKPPPTVNPSKSKSPSKSPHKKKTVHIKSPSRNKGGKKHSKSKKKHSKSKKKK